MLRPKILICGKNVVRRKTLLAALKKNHQIITIGNYLKFDFSNIKQINLIIVELSSANSENSEFLRELRLKSPKIIIIAIVDNGNIEHTADFFAAGATDIFPRPFQNSLLIQRIDGLLKHQNYMRRSK